MLTKIFSVKKMTVRKLIIFKRNVANNIKKITYVPKRREKIKQKENEQKTMEVRRSYWEKVFSYFFTEPHTRHAVCVVNVRTTGGTSTAKMYGARAQDVCL